MGKNKKKTKKKKKHTKNEDLNRKKKSTVTNNGNGRRDGKDQRGVKEETIYNYSSSDGYSDIESEFNESIGEKYQKKANVKASRQQQRKQLDYGTMCLNHVLNKDMPIIAKDIIKENDLMYKNDIKIDKDKLIRLTKDELESALYVLQDNLDFERDNLAKGYNLVTSRLRERIVNYKRFAMLTQQKERNVKSDNFAAKGQLLVQKDIQFEKTASRKSIGKERKSVGRKNAKSVSSYNGSSSDGSSSDGSSYNGSSSDGSSSDFSSSDEGDYSDDIMTNISFNHDEKQEEEEKEEEPTDDVLLYKVGAVFPIEKLESLDRDEIELLMKELESYEKTEKSAFKDYYENLQGELVLAIQDKKRLLLLSKKKDFDMHSEDEEEEASTRPVRLKTPRCNQGMYGTSTQIEDVPHRDRKHLLIQLSKIENQEKVGLAKHYEEIKQKLLHVIQDKKAAYNNENMLFQNRVSQRI